MLSSHVLEEVERVCDHVVALDHGTLVAQGSMDELAGVSGGIELELVDIADRPRSIDDVAEALIAAGLTVDRNGPVLQIGGLPEDELFDLTARSVADAQGRIRRLTERRRSLDDLFALHAERADDGAASVEGAAR
jgi:ABC-2 type transport system ATP-binding protein